MLLVHQISRKRKKPRQCKIKKTRGEFSKLKDRFLKSKIK